VSEKEEAEMTLQQETMAVFVIRDAQALPQDIGPHGAGPERHDQQSQETV
jgi:hypothetical protein